MINPQTRSTDRLAGESCKSSLFASLLPLAVHLLGKNALPRALPSTRNKCVKSSWMYLSDACGRVFLQKAFLGAEELWQFWTE